MTANLNQISKVFETDISKQDYDKVKDELISQVVYPDLSFNYDIITQILHHDESPEIGELLIRELEKLDRDNPFILLSKS